MLYFKYAFVIQIWSPACWFKNELFPHSCCVQQICMYKAFGDNCVFFPSTTWMIHRLEGLKWACHSGCVAFLYIITPNVPANGFDVCIILFLCFYDLSFEFAASLLVSGFLYDHIKLCFSCRPHLLNLSSRLTLAVKPLAYWCNLSAPWNPISFLLNRLLKS